MASRQAFWSPPFNKLWPSSCGLTRTVNCDVSVVLVLWRFIGDITLHIYIYIHIVHIYMYIYICTYIYTYVTIVGQSNLQLAGLTCILTSCHQIQHTNLKAFTDLVGVAVENLTVKSLDMV
jgi:hypothetical protein